MTKLTRIGALIAAGETEMASRELLAAIDAAKGNRTHAAESLGVTVMALRKWADRLNLWPEIDALCERKGYHVQSGPQRVRSRKRTPTSQKKRRTVKSA